MKLNPKVQGHKWPDKLYDMGVFYLKHNKLPDELQSKEYHVQHTFKKRMKQYTLNKDDKLIYNHITQSNLFNTGNTETMTYIVVKQSEKIDIIKKYMNEPMSCALGIHSLFDKIKRKYLGITRLDVQNALNKDTALNVSLANDMKQPTIKSFRPLYPFQHWQMDLIVLDTDDLKKANRYDENIEYSYILVIIDIFSKYTYIYPCKDRKGITISKWLLKLFLSGDIPHILHSDNGSEFDNKYVKDVCEQFNVRIIHGPAHRPQTQGFVENKNKQIKKLIVYFMIKFNTYQYYDYLDRIAFSLNNTKNSVIGYTPMQIHRGRNIMLNNPFQDEDIKDVKFEYNSSIDYPSHFHETTKSYETRTEIVRNKLDDVANKREKNEVIKQKEFNLHDIVQIFSYVKDDDGIIPIQISKKVDGEYIPIENPLKHGSNPIKDLQKYRILSKIMLKTNKLFPQKFQIIEKDTTRKRYKLISYPNRDYKIHLVTKFKNSKPYHSDFFYGSQLFKSILSSTNNNRNFIYIDPFETAKKEIETTNENNQDFYFDKMINSILQVHDLKNKIVYKRFYKDNNSNVSYMFKGIIIPKLSKDKSLLEIQYEDGYVEKKTLKQFKTDLVNAEYDLQSDHIFSENDIHNILKYNEIYKNLNIMINIEELQQGIIKSFNDGYFEVIINQNLQERTIIKIELTFQNYNKLYKNNGWVIRGADTTMRIIDLLNILKNSDD